MWPISMKQWARYLLCAKWFLSVILPISANHICTSVRKLLFIIKVENSYLCLGTTGSTLITPHRYVCIDTLESYEKTSWKTKLEPAGGCWCGGGASNTGSNTNAELDWWFCSILVPDFDASFHQPYPSRLYPESTEWLPGWHAMLLTCCGPHKY